MLKGRVAAVNEHGNGNVNDTYLVTVEDDRESCFILQRINTGVFRRPEHVMRNMSVATKHMQEHLARVSLPAGRRWEVPHVLLTGNGQDHWTGRDGSFWRAVSFVESSRSFDTLQDCGHAREVGFALGMFHTLISDLPVERLTDTLEGFHITPRYLRHYEKVVAKAGSFKSPEAGYCVRFVDERRAGVHVLEEAKKSGRLRVRPIHGDPKVNNVMVDVVTGRAVSIVDLDTVKPGLIQYDIGDCMRSGCNALGEETERWEDVRFEPDLCRVIMEGYLAQAREFLTPGDFAHMYDAICLITFEL
ncbi:MAG TPA: aminoglycoside phosphotransferase family protein, partial [Dissulfurispiraceae bacterium]|nr:aminoglycoside phosphotransferase family protein [Dissulfurispiraceae bacterium]